MPDGRAGAPQEGSGFPACAGNDDLRGRVRVAVPSLRSGERRKAESRKAEGRRQKAEGGKAEGGKQKGKKSGKAGRMKMDPSLRLRMARVKRERRKTKGQKQ